MSPTHEFQRYADEIAAAEGLSGAVFCGKGAFKETYRATRSDGTPVALKLIDPRKYNVVRIGREIDAMRKCNSPRIGRLLDTKSCKCADGTEFMVVVEEFFSGGTLDERITAGLSQPAQIGIARGMAMAVQELQPLRLVHRDIKPANVMFRDAKSDEPILVDFGIVRDLSQASATQSWLLHGPGTPFFASPEQLNNEKAMIDWRSDQFAVGVVACWMMTGLHPYQDNGMHPPDVVAAVANRKGPSTSARQKLSAMGFPGLLQAVAPWPVGRYATPADFVGIFKP